MPSRELPPVAPVLLSNDVRPNVGEELPDGGSERSPGSSRSYGSRFDGPQSELSEKGEIGGAFCVELPGRDVGDAERADAVATR
jgi:hypothetical protein